MCHNLAENREQPLALQKLMMRHVGAAQDREGGARGHSATSEYITESELKRTFERQLESSDRDSWRRELLDHDGQFDYSNVSFDEIVQKVMDR